MSNQVYIIDPVYNTRVSLREFTPVQFDLQLSLLKNQRVNIEKLKNTIYRRGNKLRTYNQFRYCFFYHYTTQMTKKMTSFIGNLRKWEELSDKALSYDSKHILKTQNTPIHLATYGSG